jgi:hypothetical protein
MAPLSSRSLTPASFPFSNAINSGVRLYSLSFLAINEGMVSRIHQSAKDYLIEDLKCLDQDHKSRLQVGGVAQGHADIAKSSVDAMSKQLKKNIYGLQIRN